jgi:hypothetical protein
MGFRKGAAGTRNSYAILCLPSIHATGANQGYTRTPFEAR